MYSPMKGLLYVYVTGHADRNDAICKQVNRTRAAMSALPGAAQPEALLWYQVCSFPNIMQQDY